MSRRLRTAAPPLAIAAAALGLWQLLVWALDVQDWLFPAPSAIAADFGSDAGLLLDNTWTTLEEILLGFAIAVAGGILLGVLLHLSAAVRGAVYPLLIATQTIPIVLLAPVLVIALGFDLRPKLAIVAIVCFFPLVVGTLDGLGSVSDEHRRMMLTLHASRLTILRRVELPGALPSIFTAARVSCAYVTVGAVFGEWSGASSGLGYVMQQAAPALATSRIFAAMSILFAITLALFALVSLLERALVPWARKEDVRAA